MQSIADIAELRTAAAEAIAAARRELERTEAMLRRNFVNFLDIYEVRASADGKWIGQPERTGKVTSHEEWDLEAGYAEQGGNTSVGFAKCLIDGRIRALRIVRDPAPTVSKDADAVARVREDVQRTEAKIRSAFGIEDEPGNHVNFRIGGKLRAVRLREDDEQQIVVWTVKACPFSGEWLSPPRETCERTTTSAWTRQIEGAKAEGYSAYQPTFAMVNGEPAAVEIVWWDSERDTFWHPRALRTGGQA